MPDADRLEVKLMDVKEAPFRIERKTSKQQRRKTLLAGLGIVVLVIAAAAAAWHFLVGINYVSTDNAYVGADMAMVTPLVTGAVTAIDVSDTQIVHAGDVLVRIDDADARINVAKAQADLFEARRRFGQMKGNASALAAQMQARKADIARSQAQVALAEANVAKTRVDLDRRRKLAPDGAVSADEITSATNALAAATANLTLAQASVAQTQATRVAAEGDFDATQALINGFTIDTDPAVAAAQAKLDQANLDLTRTVIRAPIDGVVTHREVQLGQRVAAGSEVMTLVPIAKAYVDANFTEKQLTRMAAGQNATLVSDLYGGDVVFHGKVVGFSGGTGASLSLIPAQNATGNWIKVVQRVPVRIAIDPQDLAAHPLRVGLSMDVKVDVSKRDSAGTR